MHVREPRTEVVHVRLSRKEHREIMDFCDEQNARSVSDLLRFAVRYLMEAGEDLHGSSLGRAIQTIDGRIKKIDREVKRLSGLVENSSRSAPTNAK